MQIGSVFFIQSAMAQAPSTSELGFGLGAINYKGEISPKYRMGNSQPAVTVFYRRDISKPVTLRASVLGGGISGTDNYFELPLNKARQARLRGTLLEGALGMEYNFLDFYDLRRHIRWTPYFFVNVAGYYVSAKTESSIYTQLNKENTFISFSIPAGAGIKYALSQNWNLGFEVGARKIFTVSFDNLDEVTSPAFANPHNNDWYFYNGFSISYTFYKIKCAKVYKGKVTPLQ
jgi:hypothetical protein